MLQYLGWLVTLGFLISIHKGVKANMATLQDLATAVAAVKDAQVAEAARVQTVIDNLKAHQGLDPASQAVIDQAVADLGTVVTNLNSEQAAPAPTPAPTPTPTPTPTP